MGSAPSDTRGRSRRLAPVRPLRIRFERVPVDTLVQRGSLAVLPVASTIVGRPLTICSVLGGTVATLTLPS